MTGQPVDLLKSAGPAFSPLPLESKIRAMHTGRVFIMVSGLFMSVALAGPAAAEDCENAGHAGVIECPADPSVLGNQVHAPADPEAQVLGLSISRDPGGAAGLPITGSDVVPLTLIGGSALAAGAVLVTGSKRRRSQA